MRIDLHTHSNISDGTDTPAELMAKAKAAGLDVIALTDHDSTAGWDAAEQALPAGLTLVPGMEMSCVARGEDGFPVAVHLLAYLFNPASGGFRVERERLRDERVERTREMGKRMRKAGLPIDEDAVIEQAGPSVGRPHLARALLHAGVVKSISEAFDDLLSVRSPYYVGKADTPLETAIELVVEAKGVPILAHPLARSRGPVIDLDVVRELEPAGLAGIEIYHPDHSAADVATLEQLARELDLIVTGSSDYHGENKGVQLGAFTTEPEQYQRILSIGTGSLPIGAPGPAR